MTDIITIIANLALALSLIVAVFLGEYFQWLAERIDERMRLNPRKPFYETNIPPGHS